MVQLLGFNVFQQSLLTGGGRVNQDYNNPAGGTGKNGGSAGGGGTNGGETRVL